MVGLEKLGSDALGRGWSILPCLATKAPAVKTWKKYQTEKPTGDDLHAWVNDQKTQCLGVVTGELSGVVVFDFDGSEGEKTMRSLGLKPHVRTGSGGYHVYFKHPGFPVKTLNGKAKTALGADFPGLDIRGDGGYAVFSGESAKGEYLFLRDFADLDSLDVLPLEVRQALGLVPPETGLEAPATSTPLRISQTGTGAAFSLPAGRSSALAERKLNEAIGKARKDGRNNAGTWLAQQLRDNHVTFEDAIPLLREYREAVTGLPDGHGEHSPYTWEEATTTLKGAYNSPARPPEGKQKLPNLRSRSVFESMFSLGELLAQPDKGWYLRNFLGPQELVMIAGQPGSGKTFLVLDLCMSLVLGRDWANNFPFEAQESLRVAYFAGEGTGRLRQRVQALLKGHSVSLEDVGDRFQVFGGVPNLADTEDPNSVLRIVEEYRTRGIPSPQVIVVDTLARATPGNDENSSRDAGLVIQALDYLKTELGCSVIVVHHTGKEGTSERGSSAFRGAVDALFKVVSNEKGSELTAEKVKDAEEFANLPFSLLPIDESCCISWGGTVKVDPYLTFLRAHQGERLTVDVISAGIGSEKVSTQTHRNHLNKLVEAKKANTLVTPSKATVWWVEPRKEGPINMNFETNTIDY